MDENRRSGVVKKRESAGPVPAAGTKASSARSASAASGKAPAKRGETVRTAKPAASRTPVSASTSARAATVKRTTSESAVRRTGTASVSRTASARTAGTASVSRTASARTAGTASVSRTASARTAGTASVSRTTTARTAGTVSVSRTPTAGTAGTVRKRSASRVRSSTQSKALPQRKATSSRPSVVRKVSGNGRKGKGLNLALRNKNGFTFFGKVILVIAAVLVIGALYHIHAWGSLYWKDVVVEGVYVDGVSLAGMTYEEADAFLEEQKAEALSMVSVNLRDSETGLSWQWDADDFHADIDLTGVKEGFRAAGRTGGVIARRKEVYALMEEPLYLTTEITLDESMADQLVSSAASEIDSDPVDAEVTFDPKVRDMWTYTEEIPGRLTDVEATAEAIRQDLAGDFNADVSAVVETIEPDRTVENISLATQNEVTFSTKVSGSDARKTNIQLAMAAVTGTVLWPGEEFSFNSIVGERTESRGFMEATVIGRNKGYDSGIGGGVCQVSTTIYCCALKADLTTTKWRPHSFPSTYVDPGLDATVNWPDKDMCFVNDTEGPIFIKCTYIDDMAQVTMYRLPYEDNVTRVEISSEILSQGETPDPEIIEDVEGKYVTYTNETYTMKVSRPQMEVRNTRQYFAGSELVREEEIHIAKFSEIKGVIYVGVTEPEGGSND